MSFVTSALIALLVGHPHRVEYLVKDVPVVTTLDAKLLPSINLACQTLDRRLQAQKFKSRVTDYSLKVGRKGDFVYVLFSLPRDPNRTSFGMGPDLSGCILVIEGGNKFVKAIIPS